MGTIEGQHHGYLGPFYKVGVVIKSPCQMLCGLLGQWNTGTSLVEISILFHSSEVQQYGLGIEGEHLSALSSFVFYLLLLFLFCCFVILLLFVSLLFLFCCCVYNREYNDWIMVRLQHMNDLVTQGSELVQREVLFIQNFPLEEILKTDVEELLREADSLVAGQDQLTQVSMWGKSQS